MVRGALPETVWNNPPVWSRWQQLLPHALAAVDPDRPRDDVPEELCWLLDRAAVYQQTRGEPRAALPLFRRAHSVGRAGLGDDHPITLTSASDLARVLHALGQYQQTRDLNEDTLARRRRILGEEAPVLACFHDPGTLFGPFRLRALRPGANPPTRRRSPDRSTGARDSGPGSC